MIFARRESEHNRGTGCEKTARPGLCGGPPVTGVPTARALKDVVKKLQTGSVYENRKTQETRIK